MKGIFSARAGGSHQLILYEAILRTTKPILELGAGDSSTVQIHTIAKSRIVTIESSPVWLNKYMYLRSANHELLLLSEIAMIDFFRKDQTEWGVVFVDSSSWIGRYAAIEKYRNTADYIVVHDTEYSAPQGHFGKVINGKRDFSDEFKYWIEFQPVGHPLPSTVLASNKIDIRGMVIEGTIKTNESK